MVARHDLIHSSSVHQDSYRRSSSIFPSCFSSSGVLHFFVLLSYPIFSVCGRLSPYDLEMLPIRPQQASSFRYWFSQKLRLNLPSKDAFNFICGTSCHFLLRSFHSTLSILSGGFCVMSSSSIIPSSQVHVLFFPCPVRVLPKSFQSYSFLISF